MKCFLCNEETSDDDLKGTFSCAYHPTPVFHKYSALNNYLLKVTFYIKFDGKEYEVILKPREERSEVNLVRRFAYNGTSQPPNNTRAWGNSKGFSIPVTVKNFEFILDIRPENAIEKIKTIITFS